MIQRCDGTRFALEPLTTNRIRGNVIGQDLDRHRAIKAGVAGFVDLAHAPSANRAEDFVWAEAGASGKGHQLPGDCEVTRKLGGWARNNLSLSLENCQRYRQTVIDGCADEIFTLRPQPGGLG
jgi:hypothetical protein